MVDITLDMSPATLKDILENLRQRQKRNLAFKATVWGQEAKEVFAREVEKKIKKAEETLRAKGVLV